MTNSEFSNFFETFYLQEVNKANRAKFVCHNQDSWHWGAQNSNTLDTLALNDHPWSQTVLKHFLRVQNQRIMIKNLYIHNQASFSLRNWPSVFSSMGLQCHVSNFAIRSSMYLCDSSDSPFSSHSICIHCHHHVVHLDISTIYAPLLSWDKWRENIGCPSDPKRIYDSLHKFYTISWVLGSFDWTLRYIGRGTTKQHVVWTQIRSIIRVVWNTANRSRVVIDPHIATEVISMQNMASEVISMHD